MHLALVLELFVNRFKFAAKILELAILLVRLLLELKDLRAELELEYVISVGRETVPLRVTRNAHLLEIVSERCRFGLLGFEVRFLFRQSTRQLFDLVRQRLNVCLLFVEQLCRSTRTESAPSEPQRRNTTSQTETHLPRLALPVLRLLHLLPPFLRHSLHLLPLNLFPLVQVRQQLFDLALLGIESGLDVFEFECEGRGAVAVGVEFLGPPLTGSNVDKQCVQEKRRNGEPTFSS